MPEAAEWDARFRAGDHSEASADPFLLSAEPFFEVIPKGGAALDLACGAGRHAVWLAERGYRVTAVDFSTEALAKTERLARERGVEVQCLPLDLESPNIDLGAEVYDMICGFFFLHRPLFPALRRALRPGGLMIYKTYTVDQLRYPGKPRHAMHLLEHNELLKLLEGFRILSYGEKWRPAGIAAVVAQKTG